MTRSSRIARARLLMVLLAACGTPKDAPAHDAGDSADPSEEAGRSARDAAIDQDFNGYFEVDLLRTTSSPIFLLAHDQEGHGFGVLTSKDVFGNPVRVMGVSIIDGGEVFRLEVDAEGRPALIATAAHAVRVASYGDGTMHLVHARPGQPVEEEDVAISAEELAAVTVPPPGLDFVEKDADGSVANGLLTFATNMEQGLLTASKCAVDNVLAIKSWKRFAFDVGTCAVLDVEKTKWVFAAAKLAADSGECAVGVGAGAVLGASLLTGPVATIVVGALGATAVNGVLTCRDLLNGEDAEALARATQSAKTLVDTPLEWERSEEPSVFTVEIVAPDVVPLGSLVDLNALTQGGEPPFASVWKINGVLSPTESLYITDTPRERTQYEVGVQYRSGGIAYYATATKTIAVCGDGACSPDENPQLCASDCGTADGGALDGGMLDAGNAEAGAAVGEGGVAADAGAGSVVGDDPTGAPAVTYNGFGVGDPHLTTFDGVRYDVQPAGELTFVASNDGTFEVQARTQPYGTSDRIAVIVAAAIKVGGQRVVIDVDGSTRVDGRGVVWAQGVTRLANGVSLYRSGLNFVLVTADGTQVRVATGGRYMNVGIHLADALHGLVVGLLGDSDGARVGDLVVRTGGALPDSPTFSYFYGVYVESWRVTPSTSLFDYRAGESTETFSNRGFPAGPATSDGLNGAMRDGALAQCTQAGVSAEWLEACVVDVGYTGDSSFITGLRGLPAPSSTLTLRPDVTQGPTGGVLNPPGASSDGSLVGMLGVGSQNFTIAANAGQTLWARLVDLGSGTFTPTLRVHDGSGAIVAQASGAAVGALSYAVPSTASYTVEIYDGSGGVNRDFVFYYALTPGANEGGALTGSTELRGTIELGDIDTYTFDGQSGKTLQVRVAGAAGASFTPAFWVYGPTGALVLSGSGAAAAGGSVVLPNAGRYTLVLSDYSTGYAGAGDYTLAFALAPDANEGGVLTGSTELRGTIELGDIDTYTFDGQSGQTVQVRVADTAGASFTPAFWLYGPSGTLALSGSGAAVAGGSVVLPSAGRYTLVLSDYSTGYAGSGDYTLAFALAPSANEGGVLTGSTELRGTIELGDIDAYTFDGQSGQTVQVRVADVAGASFTPAFWAYGPTGTLVLSGSGAAVAGGSVVLPSAGRYTLVLSDYSTGYAGAGDYTLAFALAPGANEGGALVGGSGTITLGDIDSFALTAPSGTSVRVQVTDSASGAFTPAVSIYSADGDLVTSNSGTDQASVTFRSASPSPYTVIVYDYSTGYAGFGDYQITHTLTP